MFWWKKDLVCPTIGEMITARWKSSEGKGCRAGKEESTMLLLNDR